MKHIKTVIGYKANARWFSEVDEEIIGYITRLSIETPYSYSPTHTVWSWNGKPVVQLETAHRRYDMYLVTDEHIYTTDEEATNVYIKNRKERVA